MEQTLKSTSTTSYINKRDKQKCLIICGVEQGKLEHLPSLYFKII